MSLSNQWVSLKFTNAKLLSWIFLKFNIVYSSVLALSHTRLWANINSDCNFFELFFFRSFFFCSHYSSLNGRMLKTLEKSRSTKSLCKENTQNSNAACPRCWHYFKPKRTNGKNCKKNESNFCLFSSFPVSSNISTTRVNNRNEKKMLFSLSHF